MFYCYQILCFSMSSYVNGYKFIFIILTVALWKSPPRNSVSCVYIYIYTGYQMKA